ncbi:hypothetical protein D3C80_546150 [compost metagenome]
MADMDVAVGIGRAIVQHELFAAGGGGAQLSVEVHLLPAGNGFRLLLRQAGAHREFGLGQIEGLRVIELFSSIGHIRQSSLGATSGRDADENSVAEALFKRQNPGPSRSLIKQRGKPGR